MDMFHHKLSDFFGKFSVNFGNKIEGHMSNITRAGRHFQLIWKFDFPPFMVLIIAILNDGTIMTISNDRVKPSPLPDSWKLAEIFTTGIVLGGYIAMMTVIFFWRHTRLISFLERSGFQAFIRTTFMISESWHLLFTSK